MQSKLQTERHPSTYVTMLRVMGALVLGALSLVPARAEVLPNLLAGILPSGDGDDP